jgi:hypothetical protein
MKFEAHIQEDGTRMIEVCHLDRCVTQLVLDRRQCDELSELLHELKSSEEVSLPPEDPLDFDPR